MLSITWVNKDQASDNFASVFGANAASARAAAAAAIASWERAITSFNYGVGNGNNFNVTLSMASSGTGFATTAAVTATLNGRPTAATITLGRGGDVNSDGLGDGVGWFLDATPANPSEYSSIHNVYAADAPSGNAGFGQED